MQKKITALRYTSFLAICGIIYLTVVMIVQAVSANPCELAEKANYACNQDTCEIVADVTSALYTKLSDCVKTCQKGESDAFKITLHSFIFSKNIFMALPVFCYGHCSQVQFIPIISDMKEATKRRVTIMIFFAYLLIFAVYTVNALTGYISFCGYTVRVRSASYADWQHFE